MAHGFGQRKSHALFLTEVGNEESFKSTFCVRCIRTRDVSAVKCTHMLTCAISVA